MDTISVLAIGDGTILSRVGDLWIIDTGFVLVFILLLFMLAITNSN